jgi:hypothetical protein
LLTKALVSRKEFDPVPVEPGLTVIRSDVLRASIIGPFFIEPAPVIPLDFASA